jgi:hypothetical protein
MLLFGNRSITGVEPADVETKRSHITLQIFPSHREKNSTSLSAHSGKNVTFFLTLFQFFRFPKPFQAKSDGCGGGMIGN